MVIKTYTKQLEEVQIAIAAIEAGSQSYSVGSRSLIRADLGKLYDREKWLRRMVERKDNNGKMVIKYGMSE